MTSQPQIVKGLAGVIVDTTANSTIDSEANSLTYRGYRVQDLAAACRFEDVAYLLWFGELPSADQLAAFTAQEQAQREVDANVIDAITSLPRKCHPMDTIRTAVSIMGANDLTKGDDAVANQARAISLMAKLPTVIALDVRRRHDLPVVSPNRGLGFAENFLTMCFGEVPDPAVLRYFEISLVLYAEHGFNASTFAARVTASTLADIYGSVTAAIATLKGPLHGGANEAVMDMMLAINDPALAPDWIRAELAAKRKIMGFGHRVYRAGDSRVPTMREAFYRLAEVKDGQRWKAMYEALEATMVAEKGIYPNLDFATGPAYYLMGFDIPMFTPIFAASRVVGWTAHYLEQRGANALIRPLSVYSGVTTRPLPSAYQAQA